MALIFLKEESNKKVLNLIRLHKKISGAELSRITGLGRSMLVYILRALEEKDLIEKCGIGESTSKGGKKPTLWRLNPNYGIFVGIEVLKDKLRFASTSFDGDIIAQEVFLLEHDLKDNLCEIIESKYFQFISNNRLTGNNILATSLALSGLVDPDEGKLVYSTTLNVSDIELTNTLKSKLSTEIFIINDANAGAMGVKWFPEDIDHLNSSIVYMTYNGSSKNIGSGIIIDNKLYLGASKTAGEILLPIPSFDSLMEEGIAIYGKDNEIYEVFSQEGKIEFSGIYKQFTKGCTLSRFLLSKISDFIANEIVRIVGFINPELIVIGGEIAVDRAFLDNFIIPLVESKIDQTLDKRVLIPDIRFSVHGDYSVAMGAVANIYADFM